MEGSHRVFNGMAAWPPQVSLWVFGSQRWAGTSCHPTAFHSAMQGLAFTSCPSTAVDRWPPTTGWAWPWMRTLAKAYTALSNWPKCERSLFAPAPHFLCIFWDWLASSWADYLELAARQFWSDLFQRKTDSKHPCQGCLGSSGCQRSEQPWPHASVVLGQMQRVLTAGRMAGRLSHWGVMI